MTQLHQHRDTSLHDIGGHLCVQRGPRGIRMMVQSFPELLEIAAEEIPLANDELAALGTFFPNGAAGAPLPPGAKAGLPDLPADRLDPGYTQYLDAHFDTLGNGINELKKRIISRSGWKGSISTHKSNGEGRPLPAVGSGLELYSRCPKCRRLTHPFFQGGKARDGTSTRAEQGATASRRRVRPGFGKRIETGPGKGYRAV